MEKLCAIKKSQISSFISKNYFIYVFLQFLSILFLINCSQPLKSDPEAEGETTTSEGRPRRNSKSAKWANERLDELLGYGRYQKFQAWVFIGLVSFVGSMNYFHPMLLVTKKMHRCALPEKLEKR